MVTMDKGIVNSKCSSLFISLRSSIVFFGCFFFTTFCMSPSPDYSDLLPSLSLSLSQTNEKARYIATFEVCGVNMH